jgi:signal transduction histidine kinase
MAANRSSSLGRSQSDSIDATTSKDVRLEPSKGRTDSFGKKGALAKAKEVPADKPTEALASSEREKLLAKSEFKLEPKLARSRSKSDKPDVVERSLLERISEQDAVKLAEPPAAAAPLQAPRAAPSPFADEALTVSGTAGAVVQAQPDDSAVLEQAKKIAENEARRRADWQLRQVMPQQNIDAKNQAAWSAVAPETAEFRALCEGLNEGIVARFVQDKLSLIFWLRPAQAPEFILGCVVDAADFADLWPAVLSATKSRSDDRPEFVLALLDDKARPVFTSADGKNGRDWKKPFVASEIGEALPHWEAALYLMRPEQIHESAIGLRRTLTFLVVAMLGAIALGGWLVVADARRQLALAQQKTDFVSNVSHELKTPLTSIRMFAELMLGARSGAHEKAPQYLRIIMVEAERLTRLINNVLDFAKLERRQKRFDKKPIDLHEVIERIWESQELHLRESGFSTRWIAAPPPYRVIGDEDALAQVLVNLLSNAEKYSAERKEIELHSYLDEGLVCVSVLDRGMGVPESETGKIFEAFYRAHDSLSSGIQGSGLGLTLAQRLAREHDGEVRYRAREGGGSDFTLRLPLDEPPRASSDVR